MGEDDWFEQFREHLFGMRKAAYEFGQCDRPDDHERMIAEQMAIFAMIDALMFEYCPEKMTPEQIEIYERHQRAVPNAKVSEGENGK